VLVALVGWTGFFGLCLVFRILKGKKSRSRVIFQKKNAGKFFLDFLLFFIFFYFFGNI
jgi:hypothetical protein